MYFPPFHHKLFTNTFQKRIALVKLLIFFKKKKKMSQRSGWRKSSGALVAMKTGKTFQCMEMVSLQIGALLATLTKCYHSLNLSCISRPQIHHFTRVTEDLKMIRIHAFSLINKRLLTLAIVKCIISLLAR